MRFPIRRRVLGAVGAALLLGLLWRLLLSPSGKESTATPPTRLPASTWSSQDPAASLSADPASSPPLRASGTLTLAGQVLGPDGPVAGAVVLALPTPSAAWSTPRLSPEHVEDLCVRDAVAARFQEQVEALRRDALLLAQATTDAQGRFLLERLGPEPFVLWAEKGLLLGVHAGMSAGGPEVRVRVGPGVSLTSQVLDEEGLPLEGVRVTALVRTAGRILDTTTDAEGRFVLGPLPDREEPLVLSRPGFLAANLSLIDPDRRMARLSLPHRRSGQVLDEQGPVAGATVQLENELQGTLDTVTTDAQGRFAFGDLCTSRYILVARRAGLVARQWVDVPPGQEGPPVDLLLAPALRLSGQVTDVEGQALAEAELTVYGAGEPPFTLQTKADARGRFVLEPLTPGTYAVMAQAPRHLLERVTRLFDVSQELTFALKRAETLEGQVVDEQEVPVRGAQLSLMSIEVDPEQPPALTDENGHFALGAPAAGAWRVGASHPDFTAEDVTFTAPARDLRLVLRRGASVVARVADAEGRPVENAAVSLSSAQQGARTQQEQTDAEGKAVFRRLTPGDYTVQTCSTDPGASPSERMTLADKDSRTVHLRVPRQGRLTGHIVDDGGRPVEGANLRLVRVSSIAEDCYGFANLQSGAEGYFSVVLTQGVWTLYADTTDLVLDAGASRGVEAEEEPVTERGVSVKVRVAADDAQVRLVLRPPRGKVRGRVVHEDGRPVTPFQLNGREVLDAEGRFVVPLREETLRIEAPGLAPFGRDIPAALPPKDVDLGDIVLRPLRRLEGTVVDALSSEPIPRALVRIQGQEEDELSRQGPMTYTRQDGHFVLEGVRPTDTSLGILHPLYPPADVSFTPGRPVKVRLQPGATLTGRVELGGVPVAAGTVQLLTPEGDFAATTELSRGRYTVELLQAGHYVVHVHDARDAPDVSRFAERNVRVSAGGRTVLDFVNTPSD